MASCGGDNRFAVDSFAQAKAATDDQSVRIHYVDQERKLGSKCFSGGLEDMSGARITGRGRGQRRMAIRHAEVRRERWSGSNLLESTARNVPASITRNAQWTAGH